MTSGDTNLTQEITKIERQLEQLRDRALLEMKVELAEARNKVSTLERKIAAYHEQAARPSEIAKAPAEADASRKGRTSVTIDQVVEAIRKGATNYRGVANALGCTPVTAARRIEAEGEAAGIVVTGQKAGLHLSLR